MKQLLIVTVLLMPLFISGNNISEGKQFSSQTLSPFGFTLLLPDNWKKYSYDLGYKKIIHLIKKSHVRIKVSATVNTPEERNKWEQWKSWYIKDIGRSMMQITESEMQTFDSGFSGKIILFQFRIKKTKIMQKIFFLTSPENILIIECRAPVYSYRKYSEVFHAISQSIMPAKPKKEQQKQK